MLSGLSKVLYTQPNPPRGDLPPPPLGRTASVCTGCLHRATPTRIIHPFSSSLVLPPTPALPPDCYRFAARDGRGSTRPHDAKGCQPAAPRGCQRQNKATSPPVLPTQRKTNNSRTTKGCHSSQLKMQN